MDSQLDLLANRAFEAYADAVPSIRDEFGDGPHPKLEEPFIGYWRAVVMAVLGEYQTTGKTLLAITPETTESRMKTLEQIHEINVLLGRPDALRKIDTHKVNGLNECLDVVALDAPGSGGASHHYQIRGIEGPLDHHPIQTVDIHFQEGPLQEVGANGVSGEAILAVVADRLDSFQKGPYASHDNEEALRHIKSAIEWLHRRTKERISRGVEGTHTK